MTSKSAFDRSTLDLIDDLGTYQMQEMSPIERPKRIEMPINYPRRKDIWPPEIWA